MKNKFYFFVSVFIASLVMFGCESKKLNKSKVLKLNFAMEPISLDPRFGTNVTSQSVIRALFEGLMKVSSTGDVTYGIAENYKVSEDKKTYVFKLKDSSWSDGQKVSAYDFEYAWKSAILPNSKCRVPQLFHTIKNAEKIRKKLLPIASMGVKAIDEKTLQVELEYPVPFFLNLLSNPVFSPLREDKDDFDNPSEIITNGPFQVKKYELGKRISLFKNHHYGSSDQIKIDGIEISFVKDPQTSMYMFKKKEIDYIGNPVSKIPFEEEEKLLKSGKLNIKPIAAIYWLGFNTSQFPYNNPHFRKALAYSLNNELFSQALNHKKPAKSFVPINLSNLSEKELVSWYNVNEAKKELEIALSELNYNIKDLPSLKVTYGGQTSGGKTIALLIKRQWEDNLKVKVDLEEMESNSYLAAIFDHKLDIAGSGWFAHFDDPLYHLETFKLRSYKSNWAVWENEKFVESLDKSNQISDANERKLILKEAEKIMKEDMPIVPLYYEDYRYLVKPNVHGIVITKTGGIEFRYCHID